MKTATTILAISLLVLSYLYYSLAGTVSAIETQRSFDVQVANGRIKVLASSIDSVRNRSDIAVSHLSRDNMEKVIKALKKANIVDYDSLTESYYGGFNVGVIKWTDKGNFYEDCKFWAKVKINGELEIRDCMRDIHSGN